MVFNYFWLVDVQDSKGGWVSIAEMYVLRLEIRYRRNGKSLKRALKKKKQPIEYYNVYESRRPDKRHSTHSIFVYIIVIIRGNQKGIIMFTTTIIICSLGIHK